MTTAATVPKLGFGIQEVEIRRRHLRLLPISRRSRAARRIWGASWFPDDAHFAIAVVQLLS
jgi:hypothetical protein